MSTFWVVLLNFMGVIVVLHISYLTYFDPHNILWNNNMVSSTLILSPYISFFHPVYLMSTFLIKNTLSIKDMMFTKHGKTRETKYHIIHNGFIREITRSHLCSLMLNMGRLNQKKFPVHVPSTLRNSIPWCVTCVPLRMKELLANIFRK